MQTSSDPVKIMQRRNNSLLRILLICCVFVVCCYFAYMHYGLRQQSKDKDLKLEWSKRAKDTLTSKLQDMAAEKDQQDRKFQSDMEEMTSRLSALQRQYKLSQTGLQDFETKQGVLEAEVSKLKQQHEEEEENYRLELQSFKQEKDIEISALKDNLASINHKMNQQTMDLSTCQEANSQLKHANTQKDQNISKLQSKISDFQLNDGKKQQNISRLQNMISELQLNDGMKQQNISRLQNTISELQKQLLSISQQQQQQQRLQPQEPNANVKQFNQDNLNEAGQDVLNHLHRAGQGNQGAEALRRIEEQHQVQPPNPDADNPAHYQKIDDGGLLPSEQKHKNEQDNDNPQIMPPGDDVNKPAGNDANDEHNEQKAQDFEDKHLAQDAQQFQIQQPRKGGEGVLVGEDHNIDESQKDENEDENEDEDEDEDRNDAREEIHQIQGPHNPAHQLDDDDSLKRPDLPENKDINDVFEHRRQDEV